MTTATTNKPLDILTTVEEDALDRRETTCITDHNGFQTCIALDWDKVLCEGLVWTNDEGEAAPPHHQFTNIEDGRQYRDELIEQYTT